MTFLKFQIAMYIYTIITVFSYRYLDKRDLGLRNLEGVLFIVINFMLILIMYEEFVCRQCLPAKFLV